MSSSWGHMTQIPSAQEEVDRLTVEMDKLRAERDQLRAAEFVAFRGGFEAVYDREVDEETVRVSYDEWKRR